MIGLKVFIISMKFSILSVKGNQIERTQKQLQSPPHSFSPFWSSLKNHSDDLIQSLFCVVQYMNSPKYYIIHQLLCLCPTLAHIASSWFFEIFFHRHLSIHLNLNSFWSSDLFSHILKSFVVASPMNSVIFDRISQKFERLSWWLHHMLLSWVSRSLNNLRWSVYTQFDID
jgi:hypothetical protein